MTESERAKQKIESLMLKLNRIMKDYMWRILAAKENRACARHLLNQANAINEKINEEKKKL